MTEAEKERAAVVRFLKTNRGRELNLWERVYYAWSILRFGRLLLFASRMAAGNLIERGDHLTTNKEGDCEDR